MTPFGELFGPALGACSFLKFVYRQKKVDLSWWFVYLFMVQESIARTELVYERSCRRRLLQQSALQTSFTAFQVSSIVYYFFFLSLFIISGVIISCHLIRCTFSRSETSDEWPPVIRLKIHMGKLTKHFFCLLMTRNNKLRESQLSSQLWKESFKQKSCFDVRSSTIRHSERTNRSRLKRIHTQEKRFKGIFRNSLGTLLACLE